MSSSAGEPSRTPAAAPLRRRLSSSLGRLFHAVSGSAIETDLESYREVVTSAAGRGYSALSDCSIADKSRELRRLADRLGPGERETETLALVREAARRALGMDPFDVQMVAGLAMARGRIAELPTGEGKTLALVFPAVLHALSGRGVHVLTFNDYLARRDAAWMGPVYRLLGLCVGCVQEGTPPAQKRAAYRADVTYLAAKEAGFDFLRDGIAREARERVHRAFHCALVDEADSVLIDEARVPLVVAAVEDRPEWDVRELAGLAAGLVLGRDYETDPEHRNVFLLDAGIERVEAALGRGPLHAEQNQLLLSAVHCALHASALLRRDVDYLVRDGRIEIVDELTGRVVQRRHWPDGLQAAVEAKEGLACRSAGRVLGSITLQHLLGLYPILAGTTATACPSADELHEFYGLATVVVPPHVPSRRLDLPDAVFADREAKRHALLDEIRSVHATGRPILVGTASVHESEALAGGLQSRGIACAVLNARHDEREAEIVADAGLPGAVTISTNMAGRGTDIRLGGSDERERDRVLAQGGLYVIGTNRHESTRIDQQLRGRAGRQGDPGSTRFFISLEDDLFERYGLAAALRARHGQGPSGAELPPGRLQAEVEHAQRVIEGQNFDIRRTLVKYSSLVELQRRAVQEWREAALSRGVLPPLAPDLLARGNARLGAERCAELVRSATLHHLDRLWSQHLAWIQDTRESIHLVSLGGKTPLDEFRKSVTAEFLELEARLEAAVAGELNRALEDEGKGDAFGERLKGPSSTWTYLVNDEQFSFGLGLLQSRNQGQAAATALYLGPLLVITLILDRLKARRRRRARSESPGS
jgi:preprotein translocase subunit SecA